MTTQQQAPPVTDDLLRTRYLRQIRTAVVTLAVVAVIGAVAGIIALAALVGAVNGSTSVLNSGTSVSCDVTSPNWPNC